MTKLTTFLIRADNDAEAIMRLPVNRYGSITPKGTTAIRNRFFDGSTSHYARYVLNLEAFSTGQNLKDAIDSYLANKL